MKTLPLAWRSLVRTPGPTFVAVACIGLGVGLCATLFTTVNPWLFRPLPYRDADRLLALRETLPREGAGPERLADVTEQSYRAWQSSPRSFEAMGAVERAEVNLAEGDEPERVFAARVTASLFPVLGWAPDQGRGFSEEEDRPGGAPVAILGHALWQRRFDARPDILGSTVTLDGVAHEVVGVMPPRFAFPEYAEVWTPLRVATADAPGSSRRGLDVLARLRTGVSVVQAQADLDATSAALAPERDPAERGRGVLARPLLDDLSPPGVKAGLRLVLAAGLFVLLIACANVANLMLARAAARRRDDALRVALGAGRAQLLRHGIAEAGLVSLAGGALGLALAFSGATRLLGDTPVKPPFWVQMDLDLRTVAFTAALCAASALLVGLFPALLARRADLADALKEGGRSVAGGPAQWAGRALVVAELGLSLVLLVGAALMVRSFTVRLQADPGLDTAQVLTAGLALSGPAYESAAGRAALMDELTRRLDGREGFEEVGLTTALAFPDPLGGGRPTRAFERQDAPQEPGRLPHVHYAAATSAYFRAVRLPLVEGRLFSVEEEREGRPVAVVTDRAKVAVGRRVRLEGGEWLEVVGVVREPREVDDLMWVGAKVSGQVYVPYRRDPRSRVTIVARTRSAPLGEATRLRAVVRELDPSLPLHSVFPLAEVRARAMWLSAMWGRMLSSVAVFGLVLAAAGVYGVVSYTVAQRTHEMGVRLALGAQTGDVLRLVLGQGLRMALVALAAGLLAAFALSGFLAGLLHGVETTDPWALMGPAFVLLAVTLLASYAPARRATRVDPLVALRTE